MASELEQVRDLVRRLADAPGAEFAEVLAAAGWSPQGSRGLWTLDGTRGFLKLTATPAHFSVVVKVHDPADGEDLDALTEEFETDFDADAALLTGWFGEPVVRSRFDEPPLPVQGEFILGTAWSVDERRLVLGFQQEDKEIPLRITANIIP